MTIRSFLGAIFLWLTTGIAAQSLAQSDPKALIDQLGTADFKQAETLIGQIAATGDARVVPALEAFASGDLYVRKADNLVFMTKPSGSNFTLIDPLTGESAGEAPKAAVTKIRVNNNLRRVIRAAMGGLTLLSPERSVRLSAADAVLKAPVPKIWNCWKRPYPRKPTKRCGRGWRRRGLSRCFPPTAPLR